MLLRIRPWFAERQAVVDAEVRLSITVAPPIAPMALYSCLATFALDAAVDDVLVGGYASNTVVLPPPPLDVVGYVPATFNSRIYF